MGISQCVIKVTTRAMNDGIDIDANRQYIELSEYKNSNDFDDKEPFPHEINNNQWVCIMNILDNCVCFYFAKM